MKCTRLHSPPRFRYSPQSRQKIGIVKGAEGAAANAAGMPLDNGDFLRNIGYRMRGGGWGRNAEKNGRNSPERGVWARWNSSERARGREQSHSERRERVKARGAQPPPSHQRRADPERATHKRARATPAPPTCRRGRPRPRRPTTKPPQLY